MTSSTASESSARDASQPEAAKKPNACVRASEAVDGFLQRSFYRMGYFIGHNPWWTILGALIFGLGVAALASQMETEGTRAWPASQQLVFALSALLCILCNCPHVCLGNCKSQCFVFQVEGRSYGRLAGGTCKIPMFGLGLCVISRV